MIEEKAEVRFLPSLPLIISHLFQYQAHCFKVKRHSVKLSNYILPRIAVKMLDVFIRRLGMESNLA